VWAAQQNLPDKFCTIFKEAIRPELITILRETVQLNCEEVKYIHSAMEEIKEQIRSPQFIQHRIRSSLGGDNKRAGQKASLALGQSNILHEEVTELLDQRLSQTTAARTMRTSRESLSEM
jgi:hypothetical protein